VFLFRYEKFNYKIQRGVNVYEAFESLKKDINIKKIDGFITACQICYKNGGNFENILIQFSSTITKENIQKITYAKILSSS
jgi:Flp pilus assembly protein TadB